MQKTISTFGFFDTELKGTIFMTRLTKEEKETIILFNEREDRAKIYTYNAGLRKRLETFSKKYPTCADWKKIVNKVE